MPVSPKELGLARDARQRSSPEAAHAAYPEAELSIHSFRLASISRDLSTYHPPSDLPTVVVHVRRLIPVRSFWGPHMNGPQLQSSRRRGTVGLHTDYRWFAGPRAPLSLMPWLGPPSAASMHRHACATRMLPPTGRAKAASCSSEDILLGRCYQVIVIGLSGVFISH